MMTKGEQKAKSAESENEADEVEEGVVVQRAVQVRDSLQRIGH